MSYRRKSDRTRAGLSLRRRTYAIWCDRLVGKTFGILTVDSVFSRLREDGYSRDWYAKVTCQCGTITEIAAASIYRGHSKSCGCSLKRTRADHPGWRGTADISATFFKQVRANAKQRDLEISLSIEDIQRRWDDQDGRCYFTGWPLDFTSDNEWYKPSLDRLNPEQGYHADNVAFTSWLINRLKNDVDEQDFVRLCAAISANCRGF